MSFIRSALSMEIEERENIIQEINTLIEDGVIERYPQLKLRLLMLSIKKREEIQLIISGHKLDKEKSNEKCKYKLTNAEICYLTQRDISIIAEYRVLINKERISNSLKASILNEIDTLNKEFIELDNLRIRQGRN